MKALFHPVGRERTPRDWLGKPNFMTRSIISSIVRRKDNQNAALGEHTMIEPYIPSAPNRKKHRYRSDETVSSGDPKTVGVDFGKAATVSVGSIIVLVSFPRILCEWHRKPVSRVDGEAGRKLIRRAR